MKNAFLIFVIALAFSVLISGCTKEQREEAIDRAKNAASVINGSDKSAEKEHDTPLIVKEQQKKERIRQNTEWTPENQRLHPIEYCQAQLTELDNMSKKLDVALYKITLVLTKTERKKDDNEALTLNLQNFLDDAKKKYKDAEATNKWPMELNGFLLSKEKVQEKIIEANRKIQDIKTQLSTAHNQITFLKKKQTSLQNELKQIAVLKDKVQTTINDLNTQKVIEGENGIMNALDSLNDSFKALSVNANEPALEELMAPSQEQKNDEFNAIMGK